MLFRILRNVYLYILVTIMFAWPHSNVPKFWLIRLITAISFTSILLLIVPFGILKIITKNLSKEDAEEATDDAAKWLAIYNELSEFEWRSGETIFERVEITHNTLKEMIPADESHPEIQVRSLEIYISPPSVILLLVRESNIRCYVRMETKEEFITRRTEEEFSRANKKKDHPQTTSEEAVQSMFEQQFDLIARHGKDDLLKNLYLGRRLMFLKKIAGGKTKRLPPKFETKMSPT